MPQERLESSSYSRDTLDFLSLLSKYGVKYVVVGGEAVIFYGHVRLTGDIDFFFDGSRENAERLFRALKEFWVGDVPGVQDPGELCQEGLVLQFGVPPNRIDLANRIDGVEFEEVWGRKLDVQIPNDSGETILIRFIGLGDLIRNKKAAGRPKDLDDLEFLREAEKKESKRGR